MTKREYFEAHDAHVGAFKVKATRLFGAYSLVLALVTLILRPQAYGGIAAFAVVGMWLVFGRRLILRHWYQRDSRHMQDVSVSMSDEGVSFVSEGSNASCRWNRLLAHVETAKIFLLYPTERIFYIVPKVAFQPAELPGLQQLFAQHVQPRRVPWLKRPLGFSLLLLLWVIAFLMSFVVLLLEQQPGAGNGVVSEPTFVAHLR